MGKAKRKDYEFGAEGTVIEAPKFAKLLALNTLRYTNRKSVDGAFVWGFKDGHIVTSNDPLTGTHQCGADNGRECIGVAGNIGVVGTKSFRDRVAKFLKRNAVMENFDGGVRRFI